MDVLHQDTLVLEHVTLRLEVEVVVEVLVDLASLTVLPQQAAEDTLAAHPLDLHRETRVGGTLALTVTSVTAKTLGSVHVANALVRVRGHGLADDLAILDQLADIGTRVGIRNVGLLRGVKPHPALAHTHDRSSQTPLNTKIDHGWLAVYTRTSCWEVVKGKSQHTNGAKNLLYARHMCLLGI